MSAHHGAPHPSSARGCPRALETRLSGLTRLAKRHIHCKVRPVARSIMPCSPWSVGALGHGASVVLQTLCWAPENWDKHRHRQKGTGTDTGLGTGMGTGTSTGTSRGL